MENELIKLTDDSKYNEAKAVAENSISIKSIDDVTLVKTPDGKFLAVHPGYGPSRVRECDTEKEAVEVLVQHMEYQNIIKLPK